MEATFDGWNSPEKKEYPQDIEEHMGIGDGPFDWRILANVTHQLDKRLKEREAEKDGYQVKKQVKEPSFDGLSAAIDGSDKRIAAGS